jgi:hypothetical protein
MKVISNAKSKNPADNSKEIDHSIENTPKKTEEALEDRWLGTARYPTREIKGTPFFLSRLDQACEPTEHSPRINRHGYDRDDPKDAIIQYEKAHPLTLGERIWDEITDNVLNFLTLYAPKLLSLSAGENKQRIDQKVVLKIVRDAVDKFPELKIRISKEGFDLMNDKDQVRWHKKMSIIRAAQHDYIIKELSKAYPGHIDPNPPTVLYSGGRAACLLRVLNCSVDEYLALCWSDWGLISTDSGAYKAHVFDYITEGNNINWNAHFLDFNPNNYEITEPGEYTFLGRNDRKIWSFEGPCGMLDHGLGKIPSMLPSGLQNNFTVTFNFEQASKLVSSQALAVIKEYEQRIKDSLGVTTITVEPTEQVSPEKLAKARDYFAEIQKRAEKQNL